MNRLIIGRVNLIALWMYDQIGKKLVGAYELVGGDGGMGIVGELLCEIREGITVG